MKRKCSLDDCLDSCAKHPVVCKHTFSTGVNEVPVYINHYAAQSSGKNNSMYYMHSFFHTPVSFSHMNMFWTWCPKYRMSHIKILKLWLSVCIPWSWVPCQPNNKSYVLLFSCCCDLESIQKLSKNKKGGWDWLLVWHSCHCQWHYYYFFWTL